MKSWILILVGVVVTFFAGRLLRDDVVEEKGEVSNRVVRERPERSVNSWLDASVSRERDLFLRVKIAGMESGALEDLWRDCVEKFELGDVGYEGDDEGKPRPS